MTNDTHTLIEQHELLHKLIAGPWPVVSIDPETGAAITQTVYSIPVSDEHALPWIPSHEPRGLDVPEVFALCFLASVVLLLALVLVASWRRRRSCRRYLQRKDRP